MSTGRKPAVYSAGRGDYQRARGIGQPGRVVSYERGTGVEAASLPDAAVLVRVLKDFRVRFTEADNATFNTREGAHDGLVLALALAVFGLSRQEPMDAVRVE